MTIKLSDKHNLNIIKNISYNKEVIIKEINYNNEISKQVKGKPTRDTPGIQSALLIDTVDIIKLKNLIFHNFCNALGYPSDTPYHLVCWNYVSTSENEYTGWHDHIKNDLIFLPYDYTWTFYIQMPDNLSGDEGKIIFRTEDNVEHKFLPEEGDLFIFPADLLHKPELNTSSTKERIVLAGSYSILDMSKNYKKKRQTLL